MLQLLPLSSSRRSVRLVPPIGGRGVVAVAVAAGNEGFLRPHVLGRVNTQTALLLLVHLGSLTPGHRPTITAATTRTIDAKVVVLERTIVAIVVIVIVLIFEISIGRCHGVCVCR